MRTRRRYSATTKLQVVKDALETGNGSVVARRHNLSTSMVSRWIREYKQYGDTAFKGGKGNGQIVSITDKDHHRLEGENERLKKILLILCDFKPFIQ